MGSMLKTHHVVFCLLVATFCRAASDTDQDVSLQDTGPRTVSSGKLHRRQATDGPAFTVGYYWGDPAMPMTCPPGWSAPITPTPVPAYGCCNQRGDCNAAWNTCIDYEQTTCSSANDLNACSSIYGAVLSCSTGNSKCVSFMLKTASDAPVLATSYGCGSSSHIVPVLRAAATDQASPAQSVAIETTATSVLPPASISSSASSNQTSSSTDDTSVTSSTGSPSTPTNSTSAEPQTKTVVPAVVVPVVGLIILGVIFWIWRKRKGGNQTFEKRGREQQNSSDVKLSVFKSNQARDQSRVHNGHIYNNYYSGSPAPTQGVHSTQ